MFSVLFLDEHFFITGKLLLTIKSFQLILDQDLACLLFELLFNNECFSVKLGITKTQKYVEHLIL